MKIQDIEPLLDTEIDAVAGGFAFPPVTGIWDWVPGWPWPPLIDPGDDLPPS